jgi:hypothetical protein
VYLWLQNALVVPSVLLYWTCITDYCAQRIDRCLSYNTSHPPCYLHLTVQSCFTVTFSVPATGVDGSATYDLVLKTGGFVVVGAKKAVR